LGFSQADAGIWSQVVSFVMVFKNEKPNANPLVGAMLPNAKRSLTKAELSLLKDVYLDLQKFLAGKLNLRDPEYASAILVDWMIVTGNAVPSTNEILSRGTVWKETEAGFRNRTRRTMALTWRWLARPAIIATLVVAGATAAVTEGMDYAHHHGVPYIHETPIASLPARDKSWAAIDEASNWADVTYGMEWQGVAAVKIGAAFGRSETWVKTARSWMDSVVNPAAPAASEAKPSVPPTNLP